MTTSSTWPKFISLREDLQHCKVIIGNLSLENDMLKMANNILKRDEKKDVKQAKQVLIAMPDAS